MKDMARNIEWIGEEHEEAVSKQMAQKCRQSMDHTVLAKMVHLFRKSKLTVSESALYLYSSAPHAFVNPKSPHGLMRTMPLGILRPT